MANGSGYSSSQIMAMQKDAVRRVNEMQRLARSRLAQSTGGVEPSSGSRNRQEHMPAQAPTGEQSHRRFVQPADMPHDMGNAALAEPVLSANENHGHGAEPQPSQMLEEISLPAPLGLAGGLAGPFQGILDRLGLDQETVMLLVLMLLMVNEGADTSLILALGYILL